MQAQPGYLANVSPHVDGIVALDEGSTDRSAELLASPVASPGTVTWPRPRAVWPVGSVRLNETPGHPPLRNRPAGRARSPGRRAECAE